MQKRLVSILLLLCMAFAGCSTATENNEEETLPEADTAPTAESVAEEEEEYDIFKELPAQDFGGKDFNFYIPHNAESPVDKGLYGPELVGTVFEDAVFNRNLAVENEYKVKINVHQMGNFGTTYNDMKTNVTAGDNTYDMYFTHVWTNNPLIISDNLCIEWDQIPYVQMDMPWWNQYATPKLSMANKQYFAVSSINIQDVILLLFNKEMALNHQIGDLYSYVDEGTWTMDKLGELSALAVRDLNGDGEMTAEDDQFGLVYSKGWQTPSLMYACGVMTVELDEDGAPVLLLEDEKMYTIHEKLYKLLWETEGVHYVGYHAMPDIDIHSDRALFVEYNLFVVENCREGDVDYGILPLPKYDEFQENYCTNSWTGMMCIPSTTPEDNYEMIGILMESLSFLGYRDVVPQYYDNVLKYKVSRDEDSARMIDIIRENIVFDTGLNYDTTNIAGQVMANMLTGKNPNYASTLRKKIKNIQRAYTKMYEAVLDAGE